MTARALVGLAGLSCVFLAIGLSFSLLVGEIRERRELLTGLPFAFVAGVGISTVTTSVALVAGLSLVFCVVLLAGAAVIGSIATAARIRGLPAETTARPLSTMALVPVGLVALVLAAFAVATYHQGLFSYDSWEFWTQKAVVLFHLDALDTENFTTLPGPTYPLATPVFQALVLEFSGSENPVPVGLAYVLLLAGFVGSVPFLLRGRVRLEWVLPFMLLLLVLPQVRYLAVQPIGDPPLQYFFVLAFLCAYRWLESASRPALISYGLLIAAVMSTKREGLLLALSLVIAVLVVSARRSNRRESVGPFFIATAAAFATTLPWRIWFSTHSLSGEGTGAGLGDLADQVDRIWPATRIVLQLIFDYELWRVAPWLALVTIVIGLLGRRQRPLAVLVLVTSVCIGSAFVWILWSIPDVGLTKDDGTNPMPRSVGVFVLLWCAVAPVFVHDALSRWSLLEVLPRVRRPWTMAALVPAVAFLAIHVVRGDLAFVSRTCSVAARDGEPIDAVFGHVEGYQRAQRLSTEAARFGFQGVRIAPDGCRRLRVFVPGVQSLKSGEELKQEARSVGLSVLLERAPT